MWVNSKLQPCSMMGKPIITRGSNRPMSSKIGVELFANPISKHGGIGIQIRVISGLKFTKKWNRKIVDWNRGKFVSVLGNGANWKLKLEYICVVRLSMNMITVVEVFIKTSHLTLYWKMTSRYQKNKHQGICLFGWWHFLWLKVIFWGQKIRYVFIPLSFVKWFMYEKPMN